MRELNVENLTIMGGDLVLYEKKSTSLEATVTVVI